MVRWAVLHSAKDSLICDAFRMGFWYEVQVFAASIACFDQCRRLVPSGGWRTHSDASSTLLVGRMLAIVA